MATQPAVAQAVIRTFVDTLESDGDAPARQGDPLLAAFQDLWRRSCDGMSVDWCARHARSWAEYFESYSIESIVAANSVTPSVRDYLDYRRRSIGMYPCFDLIERANHCELPDSVVRSERMSTLRGLVAEHVTLVNDLFSAEREADLGSIHNLVLILCNSHEYTMCEAERKVCEMLNERVRTFQRLTLELYSSHDFSALPGPVRQNARHVVIGMESWLRGNLDWHAATPRYQSDGRTTYAERALQVEPLLRHP